MGEDARTFLGTVKAGVAPLADAHTRRWQIQTTCPKAGATQQRAKREGLNTLG